MERIILLVEDNDDDAELTARAFEAARVPVRLVRVRSGEEALDFLFARGLYAHRVFEPVPAAVLLDLHLTGISGLEVLSQLRAHAPTARLPVLVLSASDAESDRRAASAARANAYVVKPQKHAALIADAEALGRVWVGRN